MDFSHLHSLAHLNKEGLLSLLKVGTSLSLTQTKINLLVGYSLRFHTSKEATKSYLTILSVIDKLEIKGARNSDQSSLLSFIESYYQSISDLQRESSSPKIIQLVNEVVSNHVAGKIEECLAGVSNSQKNTEKSIFLAIINAWASLSLDQATAFLAFDKLSKACMQGLRVNYKSEFLFIPFFKFFIKVVKTNLEIVEKRPEQIAFLFKKSQAVCKKYISQKSSKEKVFILACEFIILCLSSPTVSENGLAGVHLPSLFGKTYYIESYFSYFFKQVYFVLKRPNIAARLVLATKDYLVNFLKDHEENIGSTLISLNSHLKASEEPELYITIIKTIFDIFESASKKAKQNVLVPYLLTCREELNNRVSSDLINMTVKLVPEESIKSLEKLLSDIHFDMDGEEIHWTVRVLKGFGHCNKVNEVIKTFLLNFKRSLDNTQLVDEIMKALLSLSETFAEIVIEEIILTVNELLLLHEKNKWIRNSKLDYSEDLKKTFNLLGIVKVCAKHAKNSVVPSKIQEFWYLITHFIHHYPLQKMISMIELYEVLRVVSSLTPKLFASNPKASQAIFAQLSQTEQYMSTFTQTLKESLSKYISKKQLEQYDYLILISIASVQKFFELSDNDLIFDELFEYLSLDSLNFHSSLFDLIINYIQDLWKGILIKHKTPVKETLCLLKHCLSQNKNVRQLAMKLFASGSESVTSIYHSVLYSHECLSMMLNLISGLHIRSNFDYSTSTPVVSVPHTGESISLPFYKLTISEILAFFDRSFKEMFLKCIWQSQFNLLSAFQYHVYSSNIIVKNPATAHLAAQINFGQHYFNQCFYSTRLVPCGKFSLIESFLNPEKFNSWFKQQKPNTEVKNPDQSFIQLQSNLLLITDSYIQSGGSLQSLVNTLKDYSAEDLNKESKNLEIFDFFGKITAFLVLKDLTAFPSELVHTPLLAGSSAAVFYWEWLISLKPVFRSRLLQELSFSWVSFLKLQKFLYDLDNYTEDSDLLNGRYLKFRGNGYKKVLDLIVFLQKQAYSIGKDLESQKYLFKIFDLTFDYKPEPEILSSEYGLEACLRICETVIDIYKYIEDNTFTPIYAKMVEFVLFAFRKKHNWVKAYSFTQESDIQSLFEKVIPALHESKFEEEAVEILEFQFIENPATWKEAQKLQVIQKLSQGKVGVSVGRDKVSLLVVLLHNSYQRFTAWNSCLHAKPISCPKHPSTKSLLKLAYQIDESLGKQFAGLVKSEKTYTKQNLGSCKDENLFLFNKTQDFPLILNHLSSSNSCERSFYLKILSRLPERNKLYCIPQVLQCGSPQNPYEDYSRNTGEEDIWTYLTASAQQSSVFLNQLIWMLEVSLFNPEQDLSKTLGYHFYHKTLEIIKENPEEWEVYKTESEYFEKFFLVSAGLVPKDPENFAKINSALKDLSKNVPRNIYIPTNPENQVVGLRDDNGRPLQSAKRTPILITFYTETASSVKTETTQCIFKVNDDVRNDQLCLQIIDLMQDILSKTGLTVYLRPYKVISTITHTKDGDQLSGIIECIPGCKSRDEIGKEGTPSLYTYFIEKFGTESTQTYQAAKSNFIASLAGYAVASYILQIKDRHNGNILIDEFGHLVHIDFGFILKISPGGNMRFERPGFKMTEEMVEIMGSRSSESFEYFKGLIIKGYLAIREHASSFITLISLMQNSGLTCFRKGAVTDFIKRFYLNLSLIEAIKKMNEKISKANNSFFTLWYDRIQLMQQQIEY